MPCLTYSHGPLYTDSSPHVEHLSFLTFDLRCIDLLLFFIFLREPCMKLGRMVVDSPAKAPRNEIATFYGVLSISICLGSIVMILCQLGYTLATCMFN